jgi:hypothetical protein
MDGSHISVYKSGTPEQIVRINGIILIVSAVISGLV